MSDERQDLRAFVRDEEPPPNGARVVLRGGRDTEALLGTHARRLHRAFVLDGLDVYGISVFVALDDVGPASQRGLLTGKLVSYPLVYTPTVRELVDAGFDLLATFGRPHFTVVFASLADAPRLLAALGPLRPNRYA
jgi:hypothetical protein